MAMVMTEKGPGLEPVCADEDEPEAFDDDAEADLNEKKDVQAFHFNFLYIVSLEKERRKHATDINRLMECVLKNLKANCVCMC